MSLTLRSAEKMLFPQALTPQIRRDGLVLLCFLLNVLMASVCNGLINACMSCLTLCLPNCFSFYPSLHLFSSPFLCRWPQWFLVSCCINASQPRDAFTMRQSHSPHPVFCLALSVAVCVLFGSWQKSWQTWYLSHLAVLSSCALSLRGRSHRPPESHWHYNAYRRVLIEVACRVTINERFSGSVTSRSPLRSATGSLSASLV